MPLSKFLDKKSQKDENCNVSMKVLVLIGNVLYFNAFSTKMAIHTNYSYHFLPGSLINNAFETWGYVWITTKTLIAAFFHFSVLFCLLQVIGAALKLWRGAVDSVSKDAKNFSISTAFNICLQCATMLSPIYILY